MSILEWIFRAYPFVIAGVIALFHYFIYSFCTRILGLWGWSCLDSSSINELVALILQIIGGLLVLYSIDSNIGLFKNKNLLTLVFDWIKSFPINRRERVTNTANVSLKINGPQFKVRGYQKPETLDEKVALIETKLNWLAGDLKEESEERKKSIESMDVSYKNRFEGLEQSTGKISSQLEQVSIGSVKLQLLGVILLMYGSIISYVA